MSTCKSCDGKGFIEYNVSRDGGLKGTLQKCHTCKDDVKYSREVAQRYAEKPLTAKLIQFPARFRNDSTV